MTLSRIRLSPSSLVMEGASRIIGLLNAALRGADAEISIFRRSPSGHGGPRLRVWPIHLTPPGATVAPGSRKPLRLVAVGSICLSGMVEGRLGEFSARRS